MDKQKAIVNFMDAARRIVLLSERNEAIVVQAPKGYQFEKGAEIMIGREDGKRRSTDWKIIFVV